MSITAIRRPAIRSLQGWAIAVLIETGAIVECEAHGWMCERGDPHARARALDIARDDPPPGTCVAQAIAAIEQVLGSIGEACPDCLSEETAKPR